MVVGGHGSISGLAAAWYYRRAAGTAARILVLDELRRFRRPRQAQRVHPRPPPRHRLWRQPVRCNRRRRSTAMSPKGCCAISGSTSAASRPPSTAGFIPRSASPARCSSTARRSGATRWCGATPSRCRKATANASAAIAGRRPPSWRRCRSRRPARAQQLVALYDAAARSAGGTLGRGKAQGPPRPRATATT